MTGAQHFHALHTVQSAYLGYAASMIEAIGSVALLFYQSHQGSAGRLLIHPYTDWRWPPEYFMHYFGLATKLAVAVMLSMLWPLAAQAQSAQSTAPAAGEPAFLPVVYDAAANPVDFAALTAQGQWLLLWFHPQAGDTTCSVQAARYYSLETEFDALGVHVLGISPTPAVERCDITAALVERGRLLPDRDCSLAQAYGVCRMGYRRDTVLINPEGMVERIWRQVNPLDDADVVLAYLEQRIAERASETAQALSPSPASSDGYISDGYSQCTLRRTTTC